MTWQNWTAASIGLTLTALFIWALVAILRADKRANAKMHAEFDAVVAAFNALPRPKDH